MLAELIDGRENSKFVLLVDNCIPSNNGSELLYTFLYGLLKRVDEIHFFVFSSSTEDVKKQLPLAFHHKVVLHDYFSDPCGWESGQVLDHNFDIFSDIDIKGTCAIMVDNLSALVNFLSIQSFSRYIRKRIKKENEETACVQFVGLLYADLHSLFELHCLKYLSNTILHMQSSKNIASSKNGDYKLCKINHISNGKVTKLLEQFQMHKNVIINAKRIEEKMLHMEVEEEKDDSDDPTANLTFNLSLKEQEAEARSKLILPYTKKHVKVKEDNSERRDGFIYYEPDEADDFDEEDPDDDLDF